MSDLPNRAEAQEWINQLERSPDTMTLMVIQERGFDCLAAVASGRLVDREAIDYEAWLCIEDTAHERCPMGCVLPTQEGQCRLCGDPTQSRYSKVVCPTHRGRNYHRYGDGCYVTQIAETHWHAADRTGPVTQYAATQTVEGAT